mgnify:FL=1|jgi:small subunit ribosomal protein S12e
MDLMTAVPEVLKKSLAYDGVRKGLHECAKALAKGNGLLCLLAQDCDEKNYVKLVEGLCAERGVNLLRVPSGEKLGEWCGLCKIDGSGVARKVVRCSCAVVTDYGQATEAMNVVQKHFSA